jgi:hypothetical protein
MEEHRRLPPRALPLVYFAAGHVALIFALAILALDPGSVAGFFFHPRMFVVVHLITLGWISTAILGATYVVGPMALRMDVRVTPLDWVACILVLLGAAGVISHFWIGEYSGVGYSGIVLAVAFGLVSWRQLTSLSGAKSPLPVRVHVGLAHGNLLLAATLGTLLAFNKESSFLPGSHLTDVFGHVHLAGVGWAVLMVVGVGYRLLPMYLPAQPPSGARLWLSALLLEVGVLGMAASYLFQAALARWFAVVLVLGLLSFFSGIVWMLRNRVPAPPALHRPDLGMLLVLQSLLYLLVCGGIGLFLAFAEEWHLGWIMAYGVFGLLGFLSQIVLGIAMRLFPMFAWTRGWAGSGHAVLPPKPFEMPLRPLQYAVFVLWTAGVPLLAWGLAQDDLTLIRIAGGALLVAVVLSVVNSLRVLRHAFPRSRAG